MNQYNNIGFSKPKGLSRSSIIWICVGVTLLFLLLGTCTTYNSIKKSSIGVDEKWGNVQAAYQYRFDLIPQLVSTVKGAAKNEKEIAVGSAKVRALGDAEKDLTNATAQTEAFSGPDGNSAPDPNKYTNFDRAFGVYINAVHEAYPNITSTAAFKDLMAQLEGTETRIKTERIRYNEAVKEYNLSIATFPRNIVASLFGFQDKQMFNADAAAQKAVTVDFEQ